MKIAIITASYNYAHLISETIDSILAQTHDDWELIIVDDGSSDDSLNVIQAYVNQYPNIHLFQHEGGVNKGLKETVRLGLEKATGEYVAFLESDDLWVDSHLEKKVAILKQTPDLVFMFNDVQLFGESASIEEMEGYFKQAYTILNAKAWPRYMVGYFSMLNIVPTFSCVLVKKDVLKTCDFSPPVDAWLDKWLWGQIALSSPFYYLNEKLTLWRMHEKSYINSTTTDLQRQEKEKNFNTKLFQILKEKSHLENTGILNIRLYKLYLYPLFLIPRINKLLRGLIKHLLLIME
ncbi:MAG: glycosyltransferase [Vampirovibrio sp.]